jgi:hypothetical protein
VTGGYRKVNNEGLHSLYTSPNIITVMKTRRVRWLEHSVDKGDEKYVHNFGCKA